MIFTFIINSILVGFAVLIHFEALNLLSMLLPRLKIKPRLSVLFGVFGALFAHITEIWLFAFAYYFKIRSGYFGKLEGHFYNSLMDCSYFSFTTYTSLGIGGYKTYKRSPLYGWTGSANRPTADSLDGFLYVPGDAEIVER